MNKIEFKKKIWQLIETHTPIYLANKQYIKSIVDAVCSKENFNRRELLMIAYSIGATVDETNELLTSFGYSVLYAKNWEDAIWRFVIGKRMDLSSVYGHIFPQREDYNPDEKQ